MTDIRFYLRTKSTETESLDLARVNTLRNEVEKSIKHLQKLGFSSESLSEVRHILLRPDGHPERSNKKKGNQRIILGRILDDGSPILYMPSQLNRSHVDFRKWIIEQDNKEIIRVEQGSEEKIVSFDTFIEEIENHHWISPGTPKAEATNEDSTYEDIEL